jgi:hypothetical protein
MHEDYDPDYYAAFPSREPGDCDCGCCRSARGQGDSDPCEDPTETDYSSRLGDWFPSP